MESHYVIMMQCLIKCRDILTVLYVEANYHYGDLQIICSDINIVDLFSEICACFVTTDMLLNYEDE